MSVFAVADIVVYFPMYSGLYFVIGIFDGYPQYC